jgi:hypothetical protein
VNLPQLKEVGFTANRRLLQVERVSTDCFIAEHAFQAVCGPVVTATGQHVPALRLDSPTVQALLSTIVVFRLLPVGFSNKDLRSHLAPLLGLEPSAMTAGRKTYDLRRLRLHGLIERIPGTHRHRVTDFGLRVASVHPHLRAVLRPSLAEILDPGEIASPLRKYLERLEGVLHSVIEEQGLAA